MLTVESDTEFCAQLPLCETEIGEGTSTSSPGGVISPQDERGEDVAVLTSPDGVRGQKSINANKPEYKAKSWLSRLGKYCRFRQGAVLLLGIFLTILALTLVVVGGVKSRQHPSVHLVHMQTPVNLKLLRHLGDENFTFVQLMMLTNVALDRPANQSSIVASSGADVEDDAIKAVDGNLSTCSKTGLELIPEWQVDLQKTKTVKSIRIHGANNFDLHNMMIYVTDDNVTSSNSLCGRGTDSFKAFYIHIKCREKLRGKFVIIKLNNQVDRLQSLKLCEVMVFPGFR